MATTPKKKAAPKKPNAKTLIDKLIVSLTALRDEWDEMNPKHVIEKIVDLGVRDDIYAVQNELEDRVMGMDRYLGALQDLTMAFEDAERTLKIKPKRGRRR